MVISRKMVGLGRNTTLVLRDAPRGGTAGGEEEGLLVLGLAVPLTTPTPSLSFDLRRAHVCMCVSEPSPPLPGAYVFALVGRTHLFRRFSSRGRTGTSRKKRMKLSFLPLTRSQGCRIILRIENRLSPPPLGGAGGENDRQAQLDWSPTRRAAAKIVKHRISCLDVHRAPPLELPCANTSREANGARNESPETGIWPRPW